MAKARIVLTLLRELSRLWKLPLKLLKLSWVLLVRKLLSLKLPRKLLMLGKLPLMLRKLSLLLWGKLPLMLIRILSLKLGHLSLSMLRELTLAWMRRGLMCYWWLITCLRRNSNWRNIC